MNRLFQSATLKLTGWYIAILATICLMFSIIVYQITVGELQHRLASYGEQTQGLMRPSSPRDMTFGMIQKQELNEAKASLVIVLIYTNVVIVVIGGFGSYLLARRTLLPVEAAHEQQARFVSDASHELRTPLAAMTTELEVALRDPKLTKPEMKELLESNLEEVQRLTKLSTVLLALSTGNTNTLEHTPFDLVASTKMLTERYDPTGERIIIKSSKESLIVTGHQPSIEELLTILIDNALRYSPIDSHIEIRLLEHQKAVVRISNTGSGISPEHLPRIFDRFYRADASRSGNSGHGLGLALARQISDLHKAELRVTSTPNQSTEFSFSLPIIKEGVAKNQK